MIARQWRVRLGAVAEVDFANILKWTTENFGTRQAAIYRKTLMQAIGELANGPEVSGSRARNEIMSGLRARSMLHGVAGADVTSSYTALSKAGPFPPGKGGNDSSA